MTNNEEQHHDRLLRIHRRNLQHIQQQIARYGLEPPLHLLNARDHEQEQIAELARLVEAPKQALAARQAGIARHQEQLDVELPYKQPRQLLVRSRPTTQLRTRPQFRHFVWHIRLNAFRWWQAGGIAFALFVAVIAFFLWKPSPNSKLVDQLRDDRLGNVVETLELRELSIAPERLVARSGAIITLTITNVTAEPRRWLLIDGNLASAQEHFSAGTLDQSLVRRDVGPLQPGESFTLSFIPPRAGTYSFVGVSNAGQASAWGVIEIRDVTP